MTQSHQLGAPRGAHVGAEDPELRGTEVRPGSDGGVQAQASPGWLWFRSCLVLTDYFALCFV